MPTALKLDSTGDLAIENNRFVIIEKSDAIRQLIQTRLRSFINEWFLARDEGVPQLTEILVHSPNFANVEAIISTIILETPGVLDVLDVTITFDRNSRTGNIDFEARLEGDDVPLVDRFALKP